MFAEGELTKNFQQAWGNDGQEVLASQGRRHMSGAGVPVIVWYGSCSYCKKVWPTSISTCKWLFWTIKTSFAVWHKNSFNLGSKELSSELMIPLPAQANLEWKLRLRTDKPMIFPLLPALSSFTPHANATLHLSHISLSATPQIASKWTVLLIKSMTCFPKKSLSFSNCITTASSWTHFLSSHPHDQLILDFINQNTSRTHQHFIINHFYIKTIFLSQPLFFYKSLYPLSFTCHFMVLWDQQPHSSHIPSAILWCIGSHPNLDQILANTSPHIITSITNHSPSATCPIRHIDELLKW